MVFADNFRYILNHRIGQYSNGNGSSWIEAKDLKTGEVHQFYSDGLAKGEQTPDKTKEAVRQYRL